MKPLYVFTAVLIVVLLMTGVLPRLVRFGAAGLTKPTGYGFPAPVTSSYQASSITAVTEPLPTIAPFLPLSSSEQVAEALPTLKNFVASLTNGSDSLVGVYAPDRFAFPVVQQPQGSADFVSTDDNTITEFSLTKKYGSTGLLAHNFLSGRFFYSLAPGQEVMLVYGNGKVAAFRIERIEKYQALSPESPLSDFIDLSDPSQSRLTSSQLFHRIYGGAGEAIFQTCIDAYGDPSWGRMFIIAEPLGAIKSLPSNPSPYLN